MRLPTFAACSLVLLAALALPARAAQDLHGGDDRAASSLRPVTETPAGTPGAEDELGRLVPRTMLDGFRDAVAAGDHARAARYLDLSRLPEARHGQAGPELARELGWVLDRAPEIDLADASDSPAGDAGDGLTERRDRLGTIESGSGPVPILLARVPRTDGQLVWKFAPSTVARIPALYAERAGGRFVAWLPRPLVDLAVLGVQLWQWCAVLLLVLLAAATAWGGTAIGTRVLEALGGRAKPLVRALAGAPLRLAIFVVVFAAGRSALVLPLRVRAVLGGLETLLLIAALAWGAIRLLEVLAGRAQERLVNQGQASAARLMPSVRSVGRLLVLGLAAILALDNLGFDVTALVAGLGIGGIALALAAQKSVENLFGGITLYTDQPVRVGDFCRFGDRVGTVMAIGLRSTRIRTLDRTVVSVPNAQFANLDLENYTLRDKIRYHPTIGLRYETTPDQIRFILIEVRRMLYAHPKVDPDPARIRFVGFGASSLDFEIFAYVRVTDFGEYLEVAEDINLRLMDIVERAGSSFAFPSMTAYIESGTGLGDERARRAEAQVREWRERNLLYLPGFPSDKIAELGGTLDYPPTGSPSGLHGGAGNGRDGS